MEFKQVKRVKEEHQKGLQTCKEKILQWNRFKSDYEALRDRLTTLPDSLSYDITVPFGPHAFTKGKLVHTNEIMVLLGDNLFAEVTAKQAAAIATRRINQCNKMLDDLERERNQFESWLKYMDEVSPNEELIEIIEDYDEEKERSWKEQHIENLRKSKQLKKERERKISEGTNSTLESEEDYIDRLDKMELNGEMESDRSTVDCSDDGVHSEEHKVKPSLKLHINRSNFRKTSESETTDDVENGFSASISENGSPRNNKHVRWQDLSRQNIKKITFKHSKPPKQNNHHTKFKVQDSSEDENHPLIQSPSDIYKRFGNCFQASPPKSILKVKSPSPNSDMTNLPMFSVSEEPMKESSPETTDDSTSFPFAGEIREHSSPIKIETKSSRPVSHFKNSRKNRKR